MVTLIAGMAGQIGCIKEMACGSLRQRAETHVMEPVVFQTKLIVQVTVPAIISLAKCAKMVAAVVISLVTLSTSRWW